MATLHKKFSFWNKFSWFLFVGVYGILRIEIQQIIHFYYKSNNTINKTAWNMPNTWREKVPHISVFQQRELIACHKKTEQSLYQEKIHRNNLFKKNKTSHHCKFPKSQFFFINSAINLVLLYFIYLYYTQFSLVS